MDKQIFGYTESPTPLTGSLVRYMAVSKTEGGDFTLSVRDNDGRVITLTLPRIQGVELGCSLTGISTK